MEFKYIIIGRVKPVILAYGIEHNEEANGRDVTSAGSVMFHQDGSIECFGRSESLNIASKGERDALIIRTIGVNAVGTGAR